MKSLITIFLCFISLDVIACKCGAYDVDEYFSRANKVYLGELISAKVIPESNMKGGRISLAKLLVSESFKGNAFEIEEFKMEGTSCDLHLTLKDSLVIFEDGNGFTNHCSGSFSVLFNPFSENINDLIDDLRLLKKYNKKK